jgi:hypothetical protein
MALEEIAARRTRSRREFLRAAGALAAAAAGGGGAFGAVRALGSRHRTAQPSLGAPPSARSFISRPDLHPPGITTLQDGDPRAGYLFVGPGAHGPAQAGPLIVDGRGEPVFFRPLTGRWEANFRPWSFHGRPALAWWEGVVILPLGYGRGEAVIMDDSYRELARIRAVGPQPMDVHELQVTPEGTAVFATYPRLVRADLSSVGGPREGQALESVVQEVDVRSGRLLLEWRSLDHVPVWESHRPLAEPYDYFHLNSIDVAADGNLLVSGRHTWSLYKLDRRTGEVIWRLGGKRSDFDLGPGARFTWQHDAREVGPGRLTVFDNGYDGHTRSERSSRGMVLRVDERRRRVELEHAYRHPGQLQASAMGSVQLLEDGRVLVGWGSQPYLSEFAAGGRLLYDMRLPVGEQSYRGYRLPWTGRPLEPPALTVARDPTTGRRAAYVSWNGATEVAYWRLEAGSSAGLLRSIAVARRQGFETRVPLPRGRLFVVAVALDGRGRQLGRSPVVGA